MDQDLQDIKDDKIDPLYYHNKVALITGTNGNDLFTSILDAIQASRDAAQSGLEVVTRTGHGFSPGDPVYHNGTIWAKAISSASATLGYFFVTIVDGDDFTVQNTGVISVFAGLTPGSMYYVSQSVAGDLTDVKPATGYANPLLYAINATTGFIMPFLSDIDFANIANAVNRLFQTISATLDPAVQNINYFIDASAGSVSIVLPAVILADKRRYYFTLAENTNKGVITVNGGVQLIGGSTSLELESVNQYIELIANGVDGYLIAVNASPISDTAVNVEGTLNGIVIETPHVEFYHSTGTIYVEVTNQNSPTKDLSFILDGTRYLLNTTSGGGPNDGAFAALVAGADSETLFENFVYVWLNGSTPELKVSTLSTPDVHAPIGKTSLFNVARTLTEGVYKFRRYNDAPDNAVGDGFNRWLADAVRDKLGTSYDGGIDATVIVNSSPSITIATTAGTAKQVHKQPFTLQDGTEYWIYNDNANVATYESVSDLASIIETALGVSLAVNGAYYRLPVYGMQNSISGGALAVSDKLLITRPLGFYSSAAEALTDAANYDVDPNDIITEGVLFKLYTLVIARTSGGGSTWALLSTINNRSRLIKGSGGGGAQGTGGLDNKVRVSAADTTNSYLDDKIAVGDELTKEITSPGANESLLIKLKGWIFNASRNFKAIFNIESLAADRTYTLPDKNGTIAMLDDIGGGAGHDIYADDVLKATRAGLNFTGFAFIDSVGDDWSEIIHLYGDEANIDITNQVQGSISVYDVPTDTRIDQEQEEFDLILNLNQSNISANGQMGVYIPAGYKIDSIFVNETAANAAGNISIGTAAIGTQIVNAYTVGVSADEEMTLVADYFSKTADQDIFISSSVWGTGVIDITIRCVKIW